MNRPGPSQAQVRKKPEATIVRPPEAQLVPVIGRLNIPQVQAPALPPPPPPKRGRPKSVVVASPSDDVQLLPPPATRSRTKTVKVVAAKTPKKKAVPKPKTPPRKKPTSAKSRASDDISKLLIECSFCASPVPDFDSVSLESCGHIFCRNCLDNYVPSCKEAQIPCPIKEEAKCNGYLTDPEIKKLVSEEDFQEYLSRSVKQAMMEDSDLAMCFGQGCPGMAFIEGGLRNFYCPTCGKLNCLSCKMTHDRPCKPNECGAAALEIAMKLPVKETEEETQRRKEFEANWEQLRKMMVNDGASGTNGAACAAAGMNILNQLIKTDHVFECPICLVDVEVGDGVLLQECLHRFCRDCLASTIEHSEESRVKCPSQTGNFSCQAFILDREVKALVSQEIYDNLLKKSLVSAEMKMENAFHCKSFNCTGWAEIDNPAMVPTFVCFICKKQNCVPCNAIHEAINCAEYQQRLKEGENETATRTAMADLIAGGTAMRCPTCKVIILKNGGCDGMQCTVCRTHLCWATKGARWGPQGQGDTSGGCRCMFDGKRCHPKCQNCH